MTPLFRRALVTAATAAALCLLPAPSQAQECYYDVSVYADASYSDADGNLYAWGAGIDASYCVYCYHAYGFGLWIQRVATGETVAQIVNGDGTGETYAPAFAGELYAFGDEFAVWCSCYGDWVGTLYYSSVIEIPAPPPPPPPPPPQYSAYGAVFLDSNQNGQYDEGETPVEGTTVYLTDQADTTVFATYTTGSNGSYAFQGSEGAYRVKHPVPGGYVGTTDDSVPFSVPPDFVHYFGIAQAQPPPQPPQLRIYLDADNNFNPANPVSDRPTYVPGSDLTTGLSVPLPQAVTLIAAFVNGAGQIVAPPAGVTEAAFSLIDTSRFVGIAMNSGTDTGPDFTLAGSSAPFSSGDGTARIGLLAHDYGGFTRVSVSAGTFNTVMNSLPKDQDGNLIPDAGWVTWEGTGVPDGSASEDTDGTPAVSGPPSLGLAGDGFVRFEEYRGFMVYNDHRRTNPYVKDLFVSSVVTSMGTDMELGFFPASAGLATHRVRGLDESTTPDYLLDPDPARLLIVNFNTSNGGFGGPIPGHTDQRALRVKMEPGTPGAYGDTVNLATKPCAVSAGGTGGGSPNEIFPHIRIFVDQHQMTGTSAVPPNTQAEIDNEIRRTVAHEMGHGVHVKHRNQASTCDDGATVGPGPSVMDSNWYNGPPASDPRSQFNDADRAQIRLHLRP